jgi:hypothetical protein
VGKLLYDDILAKYEQDTSGLTGLNSIETELLYKMQTLVVAAAYLEEMPRQVAKITDNGMRSANTNDMQRVFGWEYKEFKQGLLDTYYSAQEALLGWLFENKDDFNLWVVSDEYSRYSELLIKNAKEFAELYTLYQPMRNYWLLRNTMRDVQDNYHIITLGSTLFEYLRDVAAPEPKEKEIIRVLKKAMAFLTIYRACRQYAVRFSENGFTIINSDEMQGSSNGAAPVPYFEHQMRSAEQDGLQQLARAKRLCYELYTAATVPDFNTAFEDSPLVSYVSPADVDKNEGLTGGFRLGV